MSTHQPTDPLGRIYAEWTEEFIANPAMSLQLMRWVFEDWQRATAEPEDVTYQSTDIGGVPGILVKPLDADPSQMLLVLHGGGFALGSSASHRKFAGHLAHACSAHAFVADFRRAPEHPYPAQIEDAAAVFDALVADGTLPKDITFVGDSAGANIAIATALTLLRDRNRTPGRVIAISPWLNMENSGTTIETNNDTDFLITREGLQGNIDRYLSGGASPTDPLVNPLYADLRSCRRCTSLPRISNRSTPTPPGCTPTLATPVSMSRSTSPPISSTSFRCRRASSPPPMSRSQRWPPGTARAARRRPQARPRSNRHQPDFPDHKRTLR